MELINLTPHVLRIQLDPEHTLELQPSGVVARVTTTQDVVEYIDHGDSRIPVVKTSFGQVSGLPEPRPEVIYITSSIVAQAAAAAGRDDVVAPDTGPSAVRGADGQILAVRRLQKF